MRATVSLAAMICAAACGRIGFDEIGDARAVDASVLRSRIAIPANTNLWGAGHSTAPAPGGAGAGVLPLTIQLPVGNGRVLTVTDVIGTIDFGIGTTSADGETSASPIPAVSYGGLVDVTCLHYNALTAVFLGDLEPADPAPPSLTIDATAASQTGIGLRQFFFMGDGLTGTNSGGIQSFAIPDAATRLYAGFSDSAGAFQPPGSYADNNGALTATFVVE